MRWTDQQNEALRRVSEWIRDPDAPQLFRLFGFAGTGKTTLAKHLAEDVDGPVIFCAYTGKAALVLRQKGCPNPTTIHKLIYIPKDKSQKRAAELEAEIAKIKSTGTGSWVARSVQGRFESFEDAKAAAAEGDTPYQLGTQHLEQLRDALAGEKKQLKRPAFSINEESPARDAALIVVDECSMVGERVGVDLMSFGRKVLVLGDPAQLPPVGDEGFFIKDKPHFLLTDIQRQARDNPIIEMATRIRNQDRLMLGTYGESSVIRRADLSKEMALAADQILVGRNATRFNYNTRMRELAGIGSLDPVEGDKLVCLSNNHEIGILNGAIYWAEGVTAESEHDPTLKLRIREDGGERRFDIEKAHRCIFQGEEPPYWERKEADQFDFGYAITVHKSQGSQWAHPLIINESGCFRQDWWKWLYTAVTRASDRVTVVNV